MRTFGITEPNKHVAPEALMKHRKGDENKSVDVIALEKENKELKVQLAYARLKSQALDTMIDLAESTYQIKVRKNSGTKQS